MAVLVAYFFVILIWATTPLAIQLSSDSLSFIAAALLRMAIALGFGLIILAVLRRKLFSVPHVWKMYAAGAVSIFPNMPVVYWSAQYIPSGLVAVIFAMSPFVTGLITMLVLKQNPFNTRRVIALLLALFGLVIIFYQQLQINPKALYGVFGILLSCFLFGFSSVLVKKIHVQFELPTNAFHQALGALLFSLPGLVLSWWLFDGKVPDVVSTTSWLAVGYLAILGSLIGITLFFYVLANMSALAVSLVTLITPLLALALGAVIAHESLTGKMWLGVFFVIFALLVYLNLPVKEFLLKALQTPQWQPDVLQEKKDNFNKFK